MRFFQFEAYALPSSDYALHGQLSSRLRVRSSKAAGRDGTDSTVSEAAIHVVFTVPFGDAAVDAMVGRAGVVVKDSRAGLPFQVIS